ncbi:MAG TPA: DUF6644 family protein [Burkholderiales bacterium]|nr:DUF6644 family protein [Burkholderiales bacterium]
MTPLAAIESLPLAVALRAPGALHGAVAIVHLTGVALLVGSVAVLDLRLLGLSRTIPVRRLAAHVLPWTAASFLLIVPSGLLLFLARAGELIGSPLFALKMMLILAGGTNAALFHAGVFRGAERWDTQVMPPAAARLAAALSLGVWFSVLACGRLLAKA